MRCSELAWWVFGPVLLQRRKMCRSCVGRDGVGVFIERNDAESVATVDGD